MHADTARLSAHVDSLDGASNAYADACRTVPGSAYGVELRTLSVARRALADRFAERLDAIGAPLLPVAGPRYVDLATVLADDPRDAVNAILIAERLLIADLARTSRDAAISEESRRLVLASLPTVRAHARRVETFLDTL